MTDECDGERETGSSLLITWSTMKMTLIGLVMMISAWFSSRRKGATAFSHTRLPKPACFFLSSFFLFFSLAGFPSIGLTFYLVDLDDFKPLDRFAQFLLLMLFKVQLWKFVILNPSTIHFFLHLDQCEAVFLVLLSFFCNSFSVVNGVGFYYLTFIRPLCSSLFPKIC